jgi:hypothetical protein
MKILFLVISVLLSCETLRSETRIRPVIFLISNQAIQVDQIVDVAHREYLAYNVARLKRDSDAQKSENNLTVQELRSFQKRLSEWKSFDPLPYWVENILIVENREDILIAFYPRDGGIKVNERNAAAFLSYSHDAFVCRLTKDYKPIPLATQFKSLPTDPIDLFSDVGGKKIFRTNYRDQPGFFSPLNAGK